MLYYDMQELRRVRKFLSNVLFSSSEQKIGDYIFLALETSVTAIKSTGLRVEDWRC